MAKPRWATPVALAALLSACGGTSAPAGGTPLAEMSEAAQAAVEPAAGGWDTLDRDGRLALMREAVTPRMGEEFRAFDGERFASFVCATCHGPDYHDVDFRMPNGLSPLDPAAIPGLADSDDERVAGYARFMFGRVTPGMVEILGVAPYDHETGRGFGCLHCHATATP